MGYTKKTGKGRLDKYYYLAKEQGFRARSAFKILQLNKKYNFFDKARCAIDLCAAPGGWLQVASKYMPVNSVIVGVDLVPIKPIPRVVTFAEDITSGKCRERLRGELKNWKADIVMHDGAPNVGTAWVQDAFAQAELVLMSLKLAVEFLAPGGVFITKVFRSKDYNNLMWVFNQLFRTVEATKPPSSRNVSAEIFVVCQDFLAPQRIDPKFLDPRHVFKDVEPLVDATSSTAVKGTSANNVQANVFQPEKKRRKREGYEEGDYILFKSVGAAEFVNLADPVKVLGSVNEITFKTAEDKALLRSEYTIEDIKVDCGDLKVLGKAEFKRLLKWRVHLREEMGLEAKKVEKAEEDVVEKAEVEEMDEDEMMRQELERLHAEAGAKARKERRRKNEKRNRTVQRMQLKMTTPMDIGMEQQEAELRGEDFFDLGEAERRVRGGTGKLGEEMESEDGDEEEEEQATAAAADEEDSEDEGGRLARLESEMDGLYERYREQLAERDAKHRAKEARRKDAAREEWHGIGHGEEDEESESDGESEGGWEVQQARKAREDEVDTDSEWGSDSEAEAEEDEGEATGKQRGSILRSAGVKRKRSDGATDAEDEEGDAGRLITSLESKASAAARQSKAAAMWFDNPLFKDVQGMEGLSDDDEDDDDDDEDDDEDEEGGADMETTASEEEEAAEVSEEEDDFEEVPAVADEDEEDWDAGEEDQDAKKRRRIEDMGLVTAEAMTLAQQLVNRKKTKTELVNEGFNRQAFMDKDGLPSWFLDDEAKHYKSNMPVTKEAIEALRAKQRALDARPIKKIAEAKARKKMRAARRLASAQKKAENINENEDLTEKEKAANISKVLAKSAKPNKKKETKVVVARGPSRGIKGRPKGVKGKYKMVDRRMKKEMRALKRIAKRDKKKGGGKKKN